MVVKSKTDDDIPEVDVCVSAAFTRWRNLIALFWLEGGICNAVMSGGGKAQPS